MAEGGTPSLQSTPPLTVYGERIARFERERDRFQHLWEQYGNARLIAFFAMVGVALLAKYVGSRALALLDIPVLIAFCVLVRKHRGYRRGLDRARLMLSINHEEIARL